MVDCHPSEALSTKAVSPLGSIVNLGSALVYNVSSGDNLQCHPVKKCDIYIILICLEIIQIKFDFCHVWPTANCTSVIFFSYNLVFRTFLCRLLRYWHQIVGMNLYCHNTEQVWLLYPFGVMPLWNLLGQVGDMHCLSNTYKMLCINVVKQSPKSLILCK